VRGPFIKKKQNVFEGTKENHDNFGEYVQVSLLDLTVGPLEYKATSGRMALTWIVTHSDTPPPPPSPDRTHFHYCVYELLAFDVRCATVVLNHVGRVYRSITSNVNCSEYSNEVGMEIDYLFPW
jgi:hypothetical protein